MLSGIKPEFLPESTPTSRTRGCGPFSRKMVVMTRIWGRILGCEFLSLPTVLGPNSGVRIFWPYVFQGGESPLKNSTLKVEGGTARRHSHAEKFTP